MPGILQSENFADKCLKKTDSKFLLAQKMKYAIFVW